MKKQEYLNTKIPIITGEKARKFICDADNPKPVKITLQQYEIYKRLKQKEIRDMEDIYFVFEKEKIRIIKKASIYSLHNEMALKAMNRCLQNTEVDTSNCEWIEYLDIKKKSDILNVQDFLADIIQVYNKYNLSIAHEDGQGKFIIEQNSINNIEWLKDADIDVKMIK